MRNSIEVLRSVFAYVSPEAIMRLYERSLALGMEPKEMLRGAGAVEKLMAAVEAQAGGAAGKSVAGGSMVGDSAGDGQTHGASEPASMEES